MTNLVPFGKYKGQPTEVLLSDESYCEWLGAQEWFRNRYATLYQIVLQGPAQPSDTPEHNQLQAWFLRDEICLALFRHLAPRADNLSPAAQDLLRVGEKYPHYFETTSTDLHLVHREFEVSGWDVVFSVQKPSVWLDVIGQPVPCSCEETHWGCAASSKCVGGTHVHGCTIERRKERPLYEKHQAGCFYNIRVALEIAGYSSSSGFAAFGDEHQVLVELKPSIGDDYPTVLRQVKSFKGAGKRVVVAQSVSCEGVTLEQVGEMFKASDVELVVWPTAPTAP